MTKYIVKFQNWDDPMVIKTISEHKTYNTARKSLNKELKDNNYILTDDKWSDKYIRAGYIPGVLIYIYWIEDDKGNKLPLNYKEDDKAFNQGNNDDLMHITVHIGKFTLFRRMSCEALHKYVHSIVAKGYKLYRRLDVNGIGRIDESQICEAFFANGIALRKEDKMIVLEQTPKSKWK